MPPCPYCGDEVSSRGRANHIRSKHPDKSDSVASTEKNRSDSFVSDVVDQSRVLLNNGRPDDSVHIMNPSPSIGYHELTVVCPHCCGEIILNIVAGSKPTKAASIDLNVSGGLKQPRESGQETHRDEGFQGGVPGGHVHERMVLAAQTRLGEPKMYHETDNERHVNVDAEALTVLEEYFGKYRTWKDFLTNTSFRETLKEYAIKILLNEGFREDAATIAVDAFLNAKREG